MGFRRIGSRASRRLASALATGLAVAALVAGVRAGAADAPGDEGAPTPQDSRDAALAKTLAHVLEVPALRGARVAALVVDEEDGGVLFEHDADRALLPASNLKLLTALASLRVFGPSHTFTTQIYADAPLDAEGAVGSLYVQGGGDPGLTSEDLWRLAADLRRQGLRRVRGDIVVDDALFDGERWHPSWQPTSARAYHAPIGALMVNYGAYAVVVKGGAANGDPLRIAIDPPVSYFQIANRGRTGASRKLVVDHRAMPEGEEVVVGGTWPRGAERTFQRSVLDPAGYAASVLRMQLEGLGIPVAGGTRRAYVPPEAAPLLRFEGRPVSDIVLRFLKYSSNPIGEALIKSLAVAQNGPPGTWPAGTAVVRRELEALGLPTAGLVQVDGSGLSYDDRATPRLLVAVLRESARSFGFGPEFVSGLPIGGTDGTLAKRAEQAGSSLRAKTGLLTRVTALSGLAKRADGRDAVFSILVNGFRGSASDAMDAVDAFAAALVDS